MNDATGELLAACGAIALVGSLILFGILWEVILPVVGMLWLCGFIK